MPKHSVAIMLVALAAIVMGGCGSEAESDISIKGRLSLMNGGTIPDSASARISLITLGNKDGRRIVAEQSVHDLGKPPIDFDLRIGKQLISAEEQYGLGAAILDADGQTLWRTDQTIRVQPWSFGSPILLDLNAVTREQVASGQGRNRYRCNDGFQFDARTDQHTATVRLGNRKFELTASNDARAPTYTDAQHNRLRIKKNSATLQVDATTHAQCRDITDSRSETK